MAAKKEVTEVKEYGVVGGWATLQNVIWRILAVFAASGLTVLGAGTVVGVDMASAIMMAGILGVATVVEKLARSFLDDGKLTIDEINDAFSKVDKNSK
jgi:hypothetical protein